MNSHLVLLDRTFLWALGVKYGIYAAWGALAGIGGIASLNITTGEQLTGLWAIVVALISASLVPVVLARKERAERWLTGAWLFFVSWYPASLFLRLITQNDPPVPHIFALSLAFLVIPFWRLAFLTMKSRRARV